MLESRRGAYIQPNAKARSLLPTSLCTPVVVAEKVLGGLVVTKPRLGTLAAVVANGRRAQCKAERHAERVEQCKPHLPQIGCSNDRNSSVYLHVCGEAAS
jgi:hypothetical protein